MIKNLISENFSPEHIAEEIKTLDMTAQVNQLVSHLNSQPSFTKAQSRRATIMNISNPHTGTLLLHCTSIGNISIRTHTPDSALSPFYSVPGQSILFALDQPFEVQLYTRHEQQLEQLDRVIVDQENPLIIDGSRTLFDYAPTELEAARITGRINLLDRSADISVFDRVSLQKIAWLPHDESAARFLVSLELLETLGDPGGSKVAEELIYHYHPAVAWKAFQLLYQADPHKALNYVPLLRKLKNPRLDNLLSPLEKAA
ncbi:MULTISPECIES: hypothetical protein [unclassified Pseudomonas]|uniref:hypothetical protein n=1 Tax=unclassified Pseudomonas TaxID=196821 RepID=UPI00119A4CE2|nr:MULTISPECIES: hypothetical protein [unclassified Pseudomonas]TWC21059.1 hypothetical protein FBY00_10370 [Pseudomonas sp. SJZ075]TWC23629.1 hypothetical protein FBX99_104255 [Pseudomonas sp. SJZ074]TWC36539.1 hypothetical protein FBY02_10370 [Pseudomonas sp. SJZ078]TWC40424.1 hypothetical protein FBY06_10436 [Pseudomonas sp. SJZ085]TWC57298.1 hypothetical protein FBY11_10370 [Pseudomonas sp. SJZ124]